MNVDAIGAEGHITGTPLLAHPLTEDRQKSGLLNRWLNRWQGDDPGISQVGQEQARTTDHFQPCCRAVVWAVGIDPGGGRIP